MVEHRSVMGQPARTNGSRRGEITIRSAQHPLVKRLGALLSGAAREARETIVLEGDRLIDDARACGVEFEVVLVSEARPDRAAELARAGLPVQSIDAGLLERKSALRQSPGIAALARAPRERTLEELATLSDALLLVVAGIADPGNLGALARSAEAAGAAGLVIVGGGVGPWSEKALRGSMGSLLRLGVARFPDAAAAVAALDRAKFRRVAAATRDGADPRRFDWSGRVALWIGSETGLDPLPGTDFARVTMPMAGRVESLNAAVAAALLLFCADRTPKGAR